MTTQSPSPPTRTPSIPYPNPVYAWYVVVVLLLAYILAFVDREIIALLVPDIKASLQISDTQMSFLLGGAFAVFYTFFGVLIAWLADRGNRRIQIFDQEGKHLDTWYQFSRISGLFIDRYDTLYAIDSESDDNYNPGWRKGLRVGSARTGEVWYFVPEHVSRQASGMGGYGSMGEGVAVDAADNVYGGEVGPIQGITKFIPRLKR